VAIRSGWWRRCRRPPPRAGGTGRPPLRIRHGLVAVSARCASDAARAVGHAPAVNPMTRFVAAEQALRDLLERNALPPPDAVEYWESSVAFFWRATKTAVVVDLDDAPEGGEGRPREERP